MGEHRSNIMVSITGEKTSVYVGSPGEGNLTLADIQRLIESHSATSGTGENSLRLGGFMWDKFPRKEENAIITGSWRFSNNIAFGGIFPAGAPIHNVGRSLLAGVIEFGSNIISSGNPVSGFAGHGFIYEANNGHLSVDNLTVRKSMRVYELVVNQIRGTNGSLWVSDTVEITGVEETPTSWRCFIDSSNGRLFVPFMAGDIVRAQRWTGTGVRYYASQVLSVTGDSFLLDKTRWDGIDTPLPGDVLVRQGNAADTNRQGALYLTSSDSNSPYMDVIDGVNSFSLAGKTRLRLGRLDGLHYSGMQLQGYGLYSDRVYLTGAIRNLAGSWMLNADGSGMLSSGAISWSREGVLRIGANMAVDLASVADVNTITSIISGQVVQVNTRVDTTNTDVSQLSTRATNDINTLNANLLSTINELGSRTNTRYISSDNPVAPAGGFRIGDEWVKVTATGSGENLVTDHESYMWFGTGWHPNLTIIDGARITTGVIDARRIIAAELFSQQIGAVRLNVAEGFVGGFTINNTLTSETTGGSGITIDPLQRSILIKALQEGQGISQVIIRAGTLTPEVNLRSSGGATFFSPAGSSQLNILNGVNLITSDNLRQAGGITNTQFVGRVSNAPELRSITPTTRFALEVGKNYAADLPYLFSIIHNGGSRNGRLHKLHGNLEVVITSSLTGVRANATTVMLVPAGVMRMSISRSDSELLFQRQAVRKVNFFSHDCVAAFWNITIQLTGDLTYQQWTSAFDGKYWMTSTGWGIDFRGEIPAGLSFNPSAGITEITTSGIQLMWANDRFFRVDGNNPHFFMESVGNWKHDGSFQLNGSNIVTVNNISSAIAADLAQYATKFFVESGFYSMLQADNRFAIKAAANTFTGNQTVVGNLSVQGDIIQTGATFITHAEKVHSKNDYIVLREGAIAGLGSTFSGLEIRRANNINNVLLVAGSDAIARVGWQGGALQAIATREDTPTSNGMVFWNQGALMFNTTPFAYTLLPRRDIAETITGSWRFNNNTRVNGQLLALREEAVPLPVDGNASAIFGRLNTWGVVVIQGGGTGGGAIDFATATHPQHNVRLIAHQDSMLEVMQRGLVRTSWGADGTFNHAFNAIFRGTLQAHAAAFFFGLVDVLNNFSVHGSLTAWGDVTIHSNIGTSIFTSGFAGAGWRLDTARHLTVDRLTVRGRMDIHELVVNQIRGTNGSLWVSDTAKISAVAGSRLTIDTGGSANLVPFVVNDLLRCQRWTGSNIKYYVVQVTAVGTNFIDVILFDGTSPREAGDHLVRQGNTTVTSRQNAIYLTSSDANNPFIDFITGVTGASLAGRTAVRVGNLSGITSATLGTLTGAGLYAENVFLRGTIVAESGRVAGFTINNAMIGHEQGGRIIAMNNHATASVVLNGVDSSIRRGFGMTRSLANNVVQAIRIGQLSGRDSFATFPATPLEGIQVQRVINYATRDIFRVDEDGAFIGGCNFSHESLWTTRWALNADGSGMLANNKLRWDTAGNMTADGSIITNEIRSANFTMGGNTGTHLDLTAGMLNFGNVIRISASNPSLAETVMRVFDPVANRVGVQIGAFPLSALDNVAGGLTQGALTGSFEITSPGSGTTHERLRILNTPGFISSTRALTLTPGVVVSNLIPGGQYILNAHVQVTLRRQTTVLLDIGHDTNIPPGTVRVFHDLRLRADIIGSAGVILNTSWFPLNYPGTATGTALEYAATIQVYFNASITMDTDGNSLSIRFRVDTPNNYVEFNDNVIEDQAYFRISNGRLIITPGVQGISLLPVTSITEVSTTGLQTLWGTNRYFRVTNQGVNLPLIRSAGIWAHEHGYLRGRFVQRVHHRALSADGAITEAELGAGQVFTYVATGAIRRIALPSAAMMETVFGSQVNANGFELTIINRWDSAFIIRAGDYRDHNGAHLVTGVDIGPGDCMKFMYIFVSGAAVNHWQVVSRSH